MALSWWTDPETDSVKRVVHWLNSLGKRILRSAQARYERVWIGRALFSNCKGQRIHRINRIKTSTAVFFLSLDHQDHQGIKALGSVLVTVSLFTQQLLKCLRVSPCGFSAKSPKWGPVGTHTYHAAVHIPRTKLSACYGDGFTTTHFWLWSWPSSPDLLGWPPRSTIWSSSSNHYGWY